MNKKLLQYVWSKEIKSLILFWGILWISLCKTVTENITGYAITLTLLGLNITLKIAKSKKGILKNHGIS